MYFGDVGHDGKFFVFRFRNSSRICFGPIGVLNRFRWSTKFECKIQIYFVSFFWSLPAVSDERRGVTRMERIYRYQCTELSTPVGRVRTEVFSDPKGHEKFI